MQETTRVFALLGDAALRRQLQQRWRGEGTVLCGMHSEGGSSIVEEMARVRPTLLLVDADLDGAREIVHESAHRLRLPVVALVHARQSGSAALRPLEWGAIALAAREPHEEVIVNIETAIAEARHAQVVDVLENHFPLSGAFPDAAVFDLRRSLQSLEPADKLVVIAAGVGGPMALRRILLAVRNHVVSPVVIAQRLSPSLAGHFAQWLEHHTGAQAVRAVTSRLEVGTVYVVPSDCDATVESRDGEATLCVGPAAHAATSFDALFKAASATYGPRAVGVLLSGHGEDGAQGLLAVRRAGGFTMVQDRSSSLVHDAPNRGRECGGAIECLPINEIAERIQMLMRPSTASRA